MSAILIALVLLSSTRTAVALEGELSAQRVTAGQPVILTLRESGPAQSPPDLSGLEADFRIVDRGSSHDVRIVNGQRSEQRTLRLTLLPRRSGTLTIPAIPAGDQTTAPLMLEVAADADPSAAGRAPERTAVSDPTTAAAPTSLSVDSTVEPARVRVAQQALLIVRVEAEGGPPAGRLEDPELPGARILPLGDQRSVTDASRYVLERRYAVFPTRAGTLDIPPARFISWNATTGERGIAESEALRVEVSAPPARDGDGPWLPARALSLSEAGPPTVRIAPGQALERMITLRADGLMAEDLPAIALQIPFQLQVREDAPRLWNERTADGVVGYRTERVLISAEAAGEFVMKGPAIAWWNTRKGKPARAKLPDWTLIVAPLSSADRRPPAVWERPFAGDSEPRRTTEDPRTSAPNAAGQAVVWISAAILAALLAGAVWLLRRAHGAQRRRRDAAGSAEAGTAPPAPGSAGSKGPSIPESAPGELTADAAAVAAVEEAYRSADPRAARRALLHWGALHWPDDPPSSLSRLAPRVSGELAEDILLLEKSFFSPQPIDWAGAPVPARLAEEDRAVPETASGAG